MKLNDKPEYLCRIAFGNRCDNKAPHDIVKIPHKGELVGFFFFSWQSLLLKGKEKRRNPSNIKCRLTKLSFTFNKPCFSLELSYHLN